MSGVAPPARGIWPVIRAILSFDGVDAGDWDRYGFDVRWNGTYWVVRVDNLEGYYRGEEETYYYAVLPPRLDPVRDIDPFRDVVQIEVNAWPPEREAGIYKAV